MRRPGSLHATAALAVGLAVGLVLLIAACGGPSGPGATGTPGSPSPAGSSATASSDYTSYVALGDSYSAAPGNPTTAQANGCVRSDHDYPHLLAAQLGIRTLHDVTCSGARTQDLTGRQATYDSGTSVAPQFDALSSDTDLVTISIGGNDMNLIGLLGQCAALAQNGATGSPCKDRYAADVEEYSPRVRQHLVAAVREVGRRAPKATVVVVGYPQPFPTDETCTQLPLASGDYAFAAQLIDQVNDYLREAAEKAGATYVDVSDASEGHDICSESPWIDGASPAPDAQPLHPFPREQTAVAGLIADALG